MRTVTFPDGSAPEPIEVSRVATFSFAAGQETTARLLATALRLFGEDPDLLDDRVALQGNMDPTVLYAKPDAIRAEVARILASYGAGTGHVFNLGHGITPEVDPAHAGAFIEAVHEFSAQYHQGQE